MKKALLIFLLILVLVALVACEATPAPEPEVTSGDTTPEAVDTTEHVHEYTEELKAPTCTEPGYFERKCSCGDVQRTDTSPKGHTYGAWEVLNAPTCNADGCLHRLRREDRGGHPSG